MNRDVQVTVIVPTHNRLDVLRETLQGYEAQDFLEGCFEVIVVDDGSTDPTPGFLRDYRARSFELRCFRQEKKPGLSGPAAARNLAIEQARGRLLLFTGDDIVPSSGLVRLHWEAFCKCADPARFLTLGRVVWHPRAPISTVMTHICGPDGEQFSVNGPGKRTQLDFRHFYTCNLSLPRSALRGARRFRTEFPRAAFEDIELGYRLQRELGMKPCYRDEPVGFHKHYHTARSFAGRQHGAGQMAELFARLHPEVDWCAGVRTLRMLLRLRRCWPGGGPADADRLAEHEELLLALLTRFDQAYRPRLEALHHATFMYFHMKGLAQARHAGSDTRGLQAYLFNMLLAPAFTAFLKKIGPAVLQGRERSLIETLRVGRLSRLYEQARSWRRRLASSRGAA